MANFENISGIIKSAIIHENKNQKEAKQHVKEKLMRKNNKFHLE